MIRYHGADAPACGPFVRATLEPRDSARLTARSSRAEISDFEFVKRVGTWELFEIWIRPVNMPNRSLIKLFILII